MWLSIWDNRLRSKSVAFGSAVFNNQESQLDSHKLYFVILGIFTQITQAGLIWVEIHIIKEGHNCRRRGAACWEHGEADCTGNRIIGLAEGAAVWWRKHKLSIMNLAAKRELFLVAFAKSLLRHVWERMVVVCTPTCSITRKMWCFRGTLLFRSRPEGSNKAFPHTHTTKLNASSASV